jgi:hypothetical protein
LIVLSRLLFMFSATLSLCGHLERSPPNYNK